MRGGKLIGKRLYKGLRDRVVVPTLDPDPPVPVMVAGGVKYQKVLDALEAKVLSGTIGQEEAPPPRSVEGALFLSETGEPEVRALDPAMLAEMGLPPPPRKYVNAWCCPFADPHEGYACIPLSVKQGGHAVLSRICKPFKGKYQRGAMVRHLATQHKCGQGASKRSMTGPLKEYHAYNRELGFSFVV